MHSSTPYSSSLFSIQLAVWLAGSLISGPQEGLKIRGGGGGHPMTTYVDMILPFSDVDIFNVDRNRLFWTI